MLVNIRPILKIAHLNNTGCVARAVGLDGCRACSSRAGINGTEHFSSTSGCDGRTIFTFKGRTSSKTMHFWSAIAGRRTYVQVSPTELYDIMGLTPKATSEQVKATYFNLSKIYHPDVCKHPGGVEKFVLISKAYEVSCVCRLAGSH